MCVLRDEYFRDVLLAELRRSRRRNTTQEDHYAHVALAAQDHGRAFARISSQRPLSFLYDLIFLVNLAPRDHSSFRYTQPGSLGRDIIIRVYFLLSQRSIERPRNVRFGRRKLALAFEVSLGLYVALLWRLLPPWRPYLINTGRRRAPLLADEGPESPEFAMTEAVFWPS